MKWKQGFRVPLGLYRAYNANCSNEGSLRKVPLSVSSQEAMEAGDVSGGICGAYDARPEVRRGAKQLFLSCFSLVVAADPIQFLFIQCLKTSGVWRKVALLCETSGQVSSCLPTNPTMLNVDAR